MFATLQRPRQRRAANRKRKRFVSVEPLEARQLLTATGWLGADFPDPDLGEYVMSEATDSASAGTAMATGVKTDAGNIAWASGDPSGGELTTIAEQLRNDKGFAIGVVSTVPFSHATPAAFVSHDTARGHKWDIAHEILFDVQPDVVIGGGLNNSYFTNATKDAAGVDRDLDDNGYNDDYDAFLAGTDGTTYEFVQRTDGVDGGDALRDAAANVSLASGEKLFGLFGTPGGNFEYYEVADSPGNPTITRSTGDLTPDVDEDPTLAEMVDETLAVLSQDEDGFFIMYEQGDIDWNNHANDYENMIGGGYDLDQAVRAAERFVNQRGDRINWRNTLVIVTSDHSNSHMKLHEWMGKGELPTQTGAPYAFDYPDGEVTYGSTSHTNEPVTLWARGRGARAFEQYAGNWYSGTKMVDNTNIYDVMMQAADEGAKHIILFVGDGMNLEHEIAASRYLYDRDFGLAWHDWGVRRDGWSGSCSTWDVDTYNYHAGIAGADAYDASVDPSDPAYLEHNDPILGFDPAKGGAAPERLNSYSRYVRDTVFSLLSRERPLNTAWMSDLVYAHSLIHADDVDDDDNGWWWGRRCRR